MSRHKERTTKSLIRWLYSRFPYRINDDTEDHLGDIKRKLRRLDRLQSRQPGKGTVTREEIEEWLEEKWNEDWCDELYFKDILDWLIDLLKSKDIEVIKK